MEVDVKSDKIVVVDYPGVVVDEARMLETLGGEENVTNVYKDPIKRLDMKWQPKDVFRKPTCADRKSSHTLLLKLTKKKGDTGAEPGEMEAEIVGIAETTYKFESLCDFQYLAMKKKEGENEYESMYDKIVPDMEKQVLSEWMKDEDCPLFLPSPIYSRMDKSVEYAYKDKPAGKTVQDQAPEGAITLDRARRPHYSKFHHFKGGDVPVDPFPEAVQRMKNKAGYKIELQNVDKIKQLFEERPLWTRIAITDMTKITKETLKHCLPLVAYYWTTGPWRTMWCRFGYDPRKNPAAKIYQLIDFRLKGNNFSEINIKRSSTKDYSLPSKVLRGGVIAGTPTIRHSDLAEGSSEAKEVKVIEKRSWKFHADTIPLQRQFFYQLIDIDVAEIQEIVHSNDGQEIQCTEKDGWCVAGYADKVRFVMMSKVTVLLEKNRKEGGTQDIIPGPSWRERKQFRELYKGKSGPKHTAKSSISIRTTPQKETLDTSLLSATPQGNEEEGDSEETSSQSDSELDISDRQLRTRALVQNSSNPDLTNLSISDGDYDENEEMLSDSDIDPEYEPIKDPVT